MVIKSFKNKPLELKGIKLKSKKINSQSVKYIHHGNCVCIKMSYTKYICIYNINFNKHIVDIIMEMNLFLIDTGNYGNEFDIIMTDVFTELKRAN